jgi:hypothetical protein
MLFIFSCDFFYSKNQFQQVALMKCNGIEELMISISLHFTALHPFRPLANKNLYCHKDDSYEILLFWWLLAYFFLEKHAVFFVFFFYDILKAFKYF